MASIKKDGNSMGLPMNIGRGNPIPLDSSEVYYSYEAAETYAQTGEVAYVGQIIVVVDEESSSAKAYQIQDTAGTLKEVGSTSITHIVETKSELITLSEAKVGEQAFVKESGENGGMYILTADPPTEDSNWSKVSSDVTWTSGSKINFVSTTWTQFKPLGSKDANTLYVITDVGKIYKGNVDVTKCINLIETESEIPEADSAVPGTLYVAKDTYAVKVLDAEESDFVTILPGYVTDGINWAQSTDDSKLVTLGVIKEKLNEEISKITSSVESAKITTVTNSFTEGKLKTTVHQGESDISSDDIELTGVAHGVKYEASKLTVELYGEESVEVDFTSMLKDKFLTSAQYDGDYDSASHQNVSPELDGKKVIIFTIAEDDTPLVVDVSALVDTYTAKAVGDTDNIKVTIEENEVSASLIITDSGDGKTILTVDESGKLTAKSPAEAVGDAIAAAIESALTDAGALKTALDKKLDKLDSGNTDEIIISTADGIVRSGKKLGGATLSSSPDASTVATEAAVAAALTWNPIE